MQYGKTEADTLHLNGWQEGDILEGVEGNKTDQILITRIGEEKFLCRWKHQGESEFGDESGHTTLTCRNWKKVGSRATQLVETSDAAVAEEIYRALCRGAKQHRLSQAPSAEEAVRFLLSLARQEAEKRKPLRLNWRLFT